DYEEESPIRVLQDLHCEIRTLKEDVSTSLSKSCAKSQEMNDFMKASEILMQRNAADLGKIRELFQKYGYKPHVKASAEEEEADSDSKVSDQNEAKAADIPPSPAGTPLVPSDPLRNPQLADFGLSQYAFYRPWSAVNAQLSASAQRGNLRNQTPLKAQTPCALPKTPKCMLKMDDYECVTPRLEHFGISEHTMCMNEDYTMALLRKTAPSNRLFLCWTSHRFFLLYYPLAAVAHLFFLRYPFEVHRSFRNTALEEASEAFGEMPPRRNTWCYRLFKDDHEVNVAKMPCREITPEPKTRVTEQSADCMASPAIPVFCTPGVKIPSGTVSSAVVAESPEKTKPLLPSHAGTPTLPDFETRWLKFEATVGNSNDVQIISLFQHVKQGEKIKLVTENDAKEKQNIEDSIPSSVSSDEYLKHLGNPSPPKIKQYDHLLSTPPPPEITRIPDDVLQILSKYNHKVDSSKAKKTETKAGDATRFDSDFSDYCNKENRYDP
ncbi:SKA3 protein, partial [Alectura lathami]|nr:SKA3 protein [Alectura lathami]